MDNKIVLAYRITTQARPLDVLVTPIHELCLLKTFYMVDIISNVQLADFNSKLHVGKIFKDIIDRATGYILHQDLNITNFFS